ncbi:hypothetical protein BDY19DRAFT_906589 [Irpex rosettiformis]|uniref:Uncharacterized protein n=1 Tax=Irpex rosettiformis TaxID=378272 RepID=A0ACB8U3C2_9APHY|nr:hypothetical protein BDY19DRAFT_906589 [Irpex rosettiformis]
MATYRDYSLWVRTTQTTSGQFIRSLDAKLEDLLQNSVDAEDRRQALDIDEAEGLELDYSPFSSPLSSVTPSPESSVPHSPVLSRRPSLSLLGSPHPNPGKSKGRNARRSRRSKLRNQGMKPMLSSPPAGSGSLPTLSLPNGRPPIVSASTKLGKRESPSSVDVPPRPSFEGIQPSKKRRNRKAKARRSERRRKHIQALLEHARTTYRHAVEYYPTEFEAEDLHNTGPCFVGKHYSVEKKYHPLQYYIEQGYRVIEWDGKDTKALLDKDRRIIAVCAGHPTALTDWQDVVDGIRVAIQELERKFDFRGHNERRGDYVSANFGVSFGGGQKRPGILKMSEKNYAAVQEFLDRLDYVQLMVRLAEHYPRFEPPIPRSVFCYEMNKASGVCPIFNTGTFDPKKGGHIILPQLRILIEFPPGTVILLPSATLVHGNVDIQDHEERESVTLFTAGGLFRWVHYGFQTEKEFKSSDSAGWKAEMKNRKGRWDREIEKFSTPESIAHDRAKAFQSL